MKRIPWLSILVILLIGCSALPAPPGLESTQISATVISTTKDVIEPSSTPIPATAEGAASLNEQFYQNDSLHVSLRYPARWQFLDGDPVSG